jgi:hypothetical protein
VNEVPEPIRQANELMTSFGRTWFLIGGWAVDAWLGRQSRDHGDVDLGYFRDDEVAVFRHLSEWHMAAHDTPDAAHDDEWDGHALDFPAHIHARKQGWPELDLNANERVGDDWIVNREPRVVVPVSEAIVVSGWGVPTLVPELVVWHKARGDVRDRDHEDFEKLLPLLAERQRTWLADSLMATDPEHRWLPRVSSGTEGN